MASSLVHVVDDDAAMRDSISFLLDTAGFTVVLYEDGASLLERLTVPASGCILTDIRMPGIDGLELLRRLRAVGHTLPVIMMTGHGDVPLAVEAMKLGACDFIEKPFDDEAILAAIRKALNESTDDEQKQNERREVLDRLALLSARERQVVDGLVDGKANKVIAFDLDISPRTVEVYRANAMMKMQAKTLSDLVRMVTIARLS